MNTITIQKRAVEKRGGVVILPLKEYQRLLRSVAPTYHLAGKAARRLDILVDEGIREYKRGRTKKIHSLADLD